MGGATPLEEETQTGAERNIIWQRYSKYISFISKQRQGREISELWQAQRQHSKSTMWTLDPDDDDDHVTGAKSYALLSNHYTLLSMCLCFAFTLI